MHTHVHTHAPTHSPTRTLTHTQAHTQAHTLSQSHSQPTNSSKRICFIQNETKPVTRVEKNEKELQTIISRWYSFKEIVNNLFQPFGCCGTRNKMTRVQTQLLPNFFSSFGCKVVEKKMIFWQFKIVQC